LLINAGYSVEKKLVTSRDIYMKDQFPDKVDVAPEYVGGVLDYLSTVNDPDAETITTSDLDETLTAGEQLMKEKGIAFLNPAEATDTNAFFVTQEYAEDNDVSKLSDLRGKKITLAGHADCEARLDCAKGLEKVYGIKLKEVLPLGFASDQTYQSVADGESQLGLTSTTDGTLEEQGFVLLEDDKSVQPVQNLVPVVSQKFLDDHTDVVDALNPLMDKLTTDDLTELNRRVGVEREKVEDVAQDYLTEQSLLG
ncbi:MAG: ABC transporter substrate-binding protein, partial [Nocardioides sp.]|nr:ABC transporter substrate-binding protein [Nocardioides sp.]